MANDFGIVDELKHSSRPSMKPRKMNCALGNQLVEMRLRTTARRLRCSSSMAKMQPQSRASALSQEGAIQSATAVTQASSNSERGDQRPPPCFILFELREYNCFTRIVLNHVLDYLN